MVINIFPTFLPTKRIQPVALWNWYKFVIKVLFITSVFICFKFLQYRDWTATLWPCNQEVMQHYFTVKPMIWRHNKPSVEYCLWLILKVSTVSSTSTAESIKMILFQAFAPTLFCHRIQRRKFCLVIGHSLFLMLH